VKVRKYTLFIAVSQWFVLARQAHLMYYKHKMKSAWQRELVGYPGWLTLAYKHPLSKRSNDKILFYRQMKTFILSISNIFYVDNPSTRSWG
jgi:hypothetical protein